MTAIGIGLSPVMGSKAATVVIAAPANLALSITGAPKDVITATWDAVAGASEYEIEYSDDGVTYAPVDTTALLTYGVTSADYVLNVDTHYVRVRATGGSTWATASIDDLLLYLVAGWLATRASGDWVDSISGITAAESGTISAVAGLFGNAARFERANSERFTVAAPPTVLTVSGVDFSYVALIRTASLDITHTMYNALHDGNEGGFYLNGDEYLNLYNIGGIETNPIPVSTWTQVAFVNDEGVESRFYINTNTDTVTTGSFEGNATIVAIGADPPPFTGFFDGDINQMLVYKGRALTSGKIARLYNGGSGLDVSTLL